MDAVRRGIAGAMSWWWRLLVVWVLVLVVADVPWVLGVAVGVVLFALAWVRPPGATGVEPRPLATPVRGRWTAVNSPATKVPSHGIRAYGQAFAIDILHPRPAGDPARVGWGAGMRRPEEFPSFGAPVLAVADGTVVRRSARQRDHRSRESWPALAWMMFAEGGVRELGGARFVLGNHLVVDHGDGTYAAYAHLRRGSLRVDVGDRVEAGQPLAEVGNTGNTTEPHLHVQLMDRPVVTAAAGLPFRWPDVEMVPGDVDPGYTRGDEPPPVEPGLPADGQIFTAAG